AEAIVDVQVPTLHVAQAAQPIDEGKVDCLRRTQHQERDAGACVGRAGRERPCCRQPAEQSDKLASPHSITSSARPSSVIGKVMPSALAARRFMTSWTFVDC